MRRAFEAPSTVSKILMGVPGSECVRIISAIAADLGNVVLFCKSIDHERTPRNPIDTSRTNTTAVARGLERGNRERSPIWSP